MGSLYEGSAAFKAGLQLNDTILEIDNTKIPVFNEYCEFRNWLLASPSQEVVMLKTRRTAEVIKVERALIPKR